MYVSSCDEHKSVRPILDISIVQKEGESALADKEGHAINNNKLIIIKDSITAINIAEPILFSVFGKENITKQRPYKTTLIDSCWEIKGTLPRGYVGGTFSIIINAADCKVLNLSHGK